MTAQAIEPLWRRALLDRARREVKDRRRCMSTRLVLLDLLKRAGEPVGLVAVGAWTTAEQRSAHLWAVAFLAGREDIPPPPHVFEASRRGR